MRWCLALLSVVGCGPASREPASGGQDEATSDADGETNEATDTAGADSAGGTGGAGGSSTFGDDDAADSSVQFDLGGTGLPEPGDPPNTCELPDRPNANVTGTTPLGEVAMTAAVFAEDGGGKCPQEYRVVLAADLAALAEEVERYGAGEARVDVIELGLRLPEGPPATGIWEASLRQIRNGVDWFPEDLTANVTSVTTLDAVDAHVEVTISVVEGEFALEGSLNAPYCVTVRGGTCGA